MTMTFKRIRIAFSGLLIACAPSAWGLQLPGALVDTEWLAAHKNQVVLLDVRAEPESFAGAASREVGHIPGAVLVEKSAIRAPVDRDGEQFIGMLPDAKSFTALMRSKGVHKDSLVVVTGPAREASDIPNPLRLLWTLQYYGHDNVAYLNGGNLKWRMEKRPWSSEASSTARGDFQATTTREDVLATTQEVEAALDQGDVQLVDARGLEYYLGLEKKPYVARAGHIPGAKVMPYPLVFNKVPLSFRDTDTLRELTKTLEIDPGKPAIVYCNSGRLSSAAWFALNELLGNDAVSMYDGSMHMWTRDDARPVSTMEME